VAVGFDTRSGAPVWISPDGTWSRFANDEAVFGGMMHSVTAGGPGLVAAGWGWRVGDAVAWTTGDEVV
jgi:hypothetical protein